MNSIFKLNPGDKIRILPAQQKHNHYLYVAGKADSMILCTGPSCPFCKASELLKPKPWWRRILNSIENFFKKGFGKKLLLVLGRIALITTLVLEIYIWRHINQ